MDENARRRFQREFSFFSLILIVLKYKERASSMDVRGGPLGNVLDDGARQEGVAAEENKADSKAEEAREGRGGPHRRLSLRRRPGG